MEKDNIHEKKKHFQVTQFFTKMHSFPDVKGKKSDIAKEKEKNQRHERECLRQKSRKTLIDHLDVCK